MKISKSYLIIFILSAYAGWLFVCALDNGIYHEEFIWSTLIGFPIAILLSIYLYRNPPPKKK
ncbi:MAG: hypothetical protein ACI9TK_001191 [Flavobacteriaceae bacterium]|jgi:hypothetical protein